MNTAQNQGYNTTLAFLGHATEQIRLTQTVGVAGILTNGGSNALGCWGKYLLQRQVEIITINSILASRT